MLSVAIDRFRKYKLDVHIAMTHASAMSAYNCVERQRAPLNKDCLELLSIMMLVGLIRVTVVVVLTDIWS